MERKSWAAKRAVVLFRGKVRAGAPPVASTVDDSPLHATIARLTEQDDGPPMARRLFCILRTIVYQHIHAMRCAVAILVLGQGLVAIGHSVLFQSCECYRLERAGGDYRHLVLAVPRAHTASASGIGRG